MEEQRSLIKIGQGEIEQIFYKNIPVLTYEQIATVHGTTAVHLGNLYRRHKAEFVEEEDTFHLDFAEANQLHLRDVVSPNGVTLFTEAGYLLLVKPMRDKVSWQVQREMRAGYFRAKALSQHQPALWERVLEKFAGLVDARLLADKAEVKAEILRVDEHHRLARDHDRQLTEQRLKEVVTPLHQEIDDLKQQLEAMQTVASGPPAPQAIHVNTVRNFVWNAVGLAGHDQVQLTGGKRLKRFIEMFEAYMRAHYPCASQDPKARGDIQYEQAFLQEAYDTPGFGTTQESRQLSGHERMTAECEAFIAAMQRLRSSSTVPFPREVPPPRRYTPRTGKEKDSA